MPRKEHYLAGLGPDKNHFSHPFRGRGRQEMEETNFAGELGKLCEAKVLKIWSGTIKIEPESKQEVKTAYEQIKRDVKARYDKTLNTDKVLEITQEIAGYENFFDDNWRFSIKFDNPVFKSLLESLDKTLGTELITLFERAASNYDFVNNKTGYLFNTAMVLARETVTPAFLPRENPESAAVHLPGKLVPNVEFKFDGVVAGQFDAISVPNEYPEERIDLLDYLEGKQPWWVMEIKVPFRPRYFSGQQKIKQPFPYDVDQFRHRLGKLMLWWNDKHNERNQQISAMDEKYDAFPLPSVVMFCYLRGVLSPVVHIMSINHHFLKEWNDRIDYSISPSGPNGERVGEKELSQIQQRLIKVPYELSFPLFAATELARKREKENKTENFPAKSISGTQLSFEQEVDKD